LRTFLAGETLSDAERTAATLQLADALLAAGEYAEALTTIRPLAATGDPAAQLLQAHIFAGAGRWTEAWPIYRAAFQRCRCATRRKLGEAESLHAMGQTSHAVEVLRVVLRAGQGTTGIQLRLAVLCLESRQVEAARELVAAIRPFTPEERKWREYIEGRLLLVQNQPREGLLHFERVLRGREHVAIICSSCATLGNGRSAPAPGGAR
jgi:thioredoxin-like negative regulator of GroEL